MPKTRVSATYIIPSMDEWEFYPLQATEVAMKCIEQGLARKKASRKEIYDEAAAIIERTQKI